MVASSGGSSGYSVAASDGVARCVIPNGTVVPARGHFLCANTIAYSLAAYPAGNGTTATPDASACSSCSAFTPTNVILTATAPATGVKTIPPRLLIGCGFQPFGHGCF